MQASSQTDFERRELRREQRDLRKTLATADGIDDVFSSKFKDYRSKNNLLWERVRYTREAVLDV